MTCADGGLIEIVSAIYSRKTNIICTKGIRDSNGKKEPSWVLQTCSGQKDVTSHAASECDGKTSCTFKPSNSMAGDPCGGKSKYATIYYTCGEPLTCMSPILYYDDVLARPSRFMFHNYQMEFTYFSMILENKNCIA